MNFHVVFFVFISVFAANSQTFVLITCGPDDTYITNPDDCTSYFQCANGVASLRHCAPSHGELLVFDPSLNVCVWPSEYDCTKPVTTTDASKTTAAPPEITTEPQEKTKEIPENTTEPTEITTEPSTTFNPCDGHAFLVNPDDCSSFYQCTNGVPELINCSSTHDGLLVFDPSLNVCVWPSDYDCTKSVASTEPTDTTTELPQTATQLSEKTTEPPESTTEPTEITTEPPTTFNPCDGHAFLVNADDCSSFYQCTNGVPELIICPSTHDGLLVFDPSLNVCVWPSDYDCTKLVASTEPASGGLRFSAPRAWKIQRLPSSIFIVSSSSPQISSALGKVPIRPYGNPPLEPADTSTKPAEITTESPEKTTKPLESATEPTETTTEPQQTTTETPEAITSPPDTINSCLEFSHPTTCLESRNNCSFCYDTCFRDGTVDVTRCDKYENLLKAGCNTFTLNRTEYDSVVKTNPNCSTWLPVEPGKKRKFSVTFSLEKHPLDLYYLMDFSNSMSNDKENLVTLSAGLLDTLANLTGDFHIGFGTFVDKPMSPLGGTKDYSFRNDFPLTAKTDGFVKKISDIPIRNGGDGPESHADALAQVIECPEQIGWRNNTRHVVLLATDMYFHTAGDGQRANINAPYVEGCYLDSLGTYTEELTMDYPSVEQIANAFSVKQATTTVIFATSSRTVSIYKGIASQFKSAYVGVLKEDSSNVLELIKAEFAKIDSRMEIEKSDTSDSVSFKYFSNCINFADERETAICENLPKTGEVTFVVEIELAECPTDKDETGVVFNLNPVGLPIFLEVELSYLCA